MVSPFIRVGHLISVYYFLMPSCDYYISWIQRLGDKGRVVHLVDLATFLKVLDIQIYM